MTTTMPRRLVIAGAALSLAAALLHFRVMPEHFAEWWGYGAFFLVVAVAQTLYAFILLRGMPAPGLVWAGIVGNLAIIILWAWTRTIGIPLFGPHAGEVETIGAIDIASKISEALLIACLILLLHVEGWAAPAGDGAHRQRHA